MLMRTALCIAALMMCVAMPFGTAQSSLVVQASSPIDSHQYSALEEVFITPSSGIYEPAPSKTPSDGHGGLGVIQRVLIGLMMMHCTVLNN